ncbi:TonB-dependent receptor [Pleionea sediminis]|uniref:TonB-dependent receptor n=1 Tax=Pleionea sediminis TaxID=2569479 RepID=UPI0013DD8D90|nr:TonB-dependent receptor [Pleionea sediminis]
MSEELDESEKNQSNEIKSKTEMASNDNVLVVRSDWKIQPINKTPSSLVVILDEKIKERNAQHLDQLLRSVGNVNFNSGASRGRFVQIRGIGERSQFQDPINPSVGFFIDGIDFSGVMGSATLYDLSQVEVLRGPQGTRFGANSLAGAIYLETESARSEIDRFDISLAEQNSLSTGIAVGGEISEAAAMRFVLHQSVSDGFIKNQFLNRDDTDNIDELNARVKTDWQVNKNFNLKIALHHWDIDNGYDAFSLDNNRMTLSDEPGFDRQATDAVSVQGNYLSSLGSEFEFSVAVSDSQLDYGYDEDWTFDGFHPDGYSSFDRYLRDKDTINLDLRWLPNSLFNLWGKQTDWIFGVYAKKDDEALTRQYTYLSGDFQSIFETKTVALYGEAQSSISEDTRLVIGARVESREADYQDVGFGETTDETMIGGRVSLQHALSEQSMVYGLIARGFKAGGVNPQSELDLINRTFDSETSINYELGYKSTLFDDAGSLRLAAFHITRDDQQTKNWQVITRDDDTQGFIGYVGNVDNGTNQGIELDINWRVSPSFELNSSIGLLETELDQILRLEDDQVITINGREQAQAPSYNYHLSGKWVPTDHWFSVLTLEGKDKEFFSDNHELRNKHTDLVHFQVGYQAMDWRLTVWVKNMTDETTYIRGFGSFGNDPRNGYATEPYFQLGAPRQVGVSFNTQF